MAYKYQPIKDEIFASDGEGDEVEDLEEGEAEEGETILSSLENVEGVAQLPPNAKVKQVIEQDGVLILETVEADPNDPDALPAGATLLADGAGGTIIAEAENGAIGAAIIDTNGAAIIDTNGTAIIDTNGTAIIDTNGATIIDTNGAAILSNGHDSTLDTTNGDSSMDDSAILAELEEANVDVKPSPSKKNKDILEQGEKVQCQLCNQSFPAGNLRWHILKEHCHNKVRTSIKRFSIALIFSLRSLSAPSASRSSSPRTLSRTTSDRFISPRPLHATSATRSTRTSTTTSSISTRRSATTSAPTARRSSRPRSSCTTTSRASTWARRPTARTAARTSLWTTSPDTSGRLMRG